MAVLTVRNQTANQITADRDFSKFTLANNHYIEGDISPVGADFVGLMGMVMGRVAATNKLTALVATATDGSQYPVGIMIDDVTVADGATENLTLVNKGTIDGTKINFLGAETLDTPVGPVSNLKTIRDLLNDLGFILEENTEIYKFDN